MSARMCVSFKIAIYTVWINDYKAEQKETSVFIWSDKFVATWELVSAAVNNIEFCYIFNSFEYVYIITVTFAIAGFLYILVNMKTLLYRLLLHIYTPVLQTFIVTVCFYSSSLHFLQYLESNFQSTIGIVWNKVFGTVKT